MFTENIMPNRFHRSRVVVELRKSYMHRYRLVGKFAIACWIIIKKPLMFALKTFEQVWFPSLEKAACIDIDLYES